MHQDSILKEAISFWPWISQAPSGHSNSYLSPWNKNLCSSSSCSLLPHKIETEVTAALGPTRPWRDHPTFLRVRDSFLCRKSGMTLLAWNDWLTHLLPPWVRSFPPFISRLIFEIATCPRFEGQWSWNQCLVISAMLLKASLMDTKLTLLIINKRGGWANLFLGQLIAIVYGRKWFHRL